jgi:hypothetical protein
MVSAAFQEEGGGGEGLRGEDDKEGNAYDGGDGQEGTSEFAIGPCGEGGEEPSSSTTTSNRGVEETGPTSTEARGSDGGEAAPGGAPPVGHLLVRHFFVVRWRGVDGYV